MVVAAHIGTMVGNLLRVWRFPGVMLGSLGSCWDYVGPLGALLAVFDGRAGPSGGHFGTMLGFLKALLRLLVPMLDRLEAMFGLWWAP